MGFGRKLHASILAPRHLDAGPVPGEENVWLKEMDDHVYTQNP